MSLLFWLVFSHMVATGTSTQVHKYTENREGCHPEYKVRFMWYPKKTGRTICNWKNGVTLVYTDVK